MYSIKPTEKFSSQVAKENGELIITLTREESKEGLPDTYISKRKIENKEHLDNAAHMALFPLEEVEFGMYGEEPNLESLIDNIIEQSKRSCRNIH